MIRIYKGLLVLGGGLAFPDFVWIEYKKYEQPKGILRFEHYGCYWMVLE